MENILENHEAEYRNSVERIGLRTIQSLQALKKFLNDNGSGRGLFSMDSNTLDFALYIKSLGGTLIPKSQERTSQTQAWGDNPRYKTTLYINQIIEIIEKQLVRPDEVEKEIVAYLCKEGLQLDQIIENNEITAILDNHVGEMCDEAFRLEINLDNDPIAQRLKKMREQQECEAKFKFMQIRMHTLERVAEMAVIIMDRAF